MLKPHRLRAYRLQDLLTRITPRHVHKEIDFGGPAGREALSHIIHDSSSRNCGVAKRWTHCMEKSNGYPRAEPGE